MSALQAIPTPHGIDILNSELKNTVTKYQLIGALAHDAASDALHSFHTATIETSYYDENGVLTFILNLPIETHFDEYLHRIDVLDSQNQAVIECPTPKIALAKGIGGIVTLKAAISGQAGDVVFKHVEHVTEAELKELYLPPIWAEISKAQFMHYDPIRQYSVGEICYIKDAETDELSYWQWYSNVESLAGKNPLSRANRRPGWSDVTKPWYWSPYHAVRPGETVWWGGAELPEDVILDNEQSLPIVVYHRLAKARPDLVMGDNIEMRSAVGRYLRAADGSTYISGQVHNDAIRNITGVIGVSSIGNSPFPSGVFYSVGSQQWGTGSSHQTEIVHMDASKQVPTATQNQPVTLIEWKGVAI